MNTRLIEEAAKQGDVQKLHNLIKDDPYLLRAVSISIKDTPLHISCISGHVDFVKEILNLRPEFATELNQDGLSPLHIASANGDIEIVKEILKLGCHLCLIKGKEKRIPLHYAVAKGRTQVIRELLSARLDTVTEVTARGESCFHLAVKNNQFEAFEVLAENAIMYDKEDGLNMRDGQGNTILHLAALKKQYEVVDLLLDKNFGYEGKLEVNSLNKNGLTPLDLLLSEGGDCEIEEMLSLYGAIRAQETDPFLQHGAISPQNSFDASQDPSRNGEQRRERSKCASKKLQDYFKYDKIKDSPTKVRSILLVIAVLIATATYQAVLSPPGGVWQDDRWPNTDNNKNTTNISSSKQPPDHTAGQAVMGTHNSVSYGLFLLFNSIGFFMSLHMINFLTLGLPLQFELRVSLMALTATYDTCIIAMTPNGKISVFFIVLSVVMPMMMPILTKVVRDCKKGRRCVSPSTRASA
ncbi:hypothetical protein BUALT_Bualt19G0024500 [Buddleja alternifolia]|uniref:PGG domain-containing protein n=1 Tax=Buddleja alternifolia TaxID=168488 RepID=A0AAV6W513_9LAMI|nr:hypothetical protein BUALT_Bualt19G0024500 [Buddleja alternifolia]